MTIALRAESNPGNVGIEHILRRPKPISSMPANQPIEIYPRLNQELKTPTLERNSGIEFDSRRIAETAVNFSASERRAATLPGRRTVKKDWQAAWQLKAVSLIDLTTLSGDDTELRVRRLAAKAREPLRPELAGALGTAGLEIRAAAVCVYHDMVRCSVDALAGSGIPTAAVSTGFPAGLSPFKLRVAEIRESVAAGAGEIDVVISRRHALSGNWRALYDEVCEFREACGDAHLKTILATGELGSLRTVARASWTCMMAGADFIKTSTGKESVNSTLPVALTMLRCIREFHEATGFKVGIKPAGGISTAKDALVYMMLVKEELGSGWLSPDLFRFGASSLLTDIERQLEHFATGRYSARHRHPAG